MDRIQSQQLAERASTRRRNELDAGRRQAIATLDFESAQAYDQKLSEQRQQESTDLIQEITAKLIQEASEVVRQAKARDTETKLAKPQSLETLSLKFHRLFTDLKTQQLAALSRLEAQYADNRLRENDRKMPEQIALLEQAKNLAIQGQFDEARRKRDESRERAQCELKRRLDKLENDFVKDLAELIRSQGTVVRDMNARYVADTALIDRQEEDRNRETAAGLDDRLQDLFEGAKAKLTTAAIKGRIYKTRPQTLAQDLWNELDRLCANFTIGNPVPCPAELAQAEQAKKKAALKRIEQSVSQINSSGSIDPIA
jgi:hypothetical protein